MPELPEVETIVRYLRFAGQWGGLSLPGQRFQSADVLWERTIAEPAASEFSSRLAGQVVLNINRCGKFIVITLERDTLLVHLRMSGDLTLEKSINDSGNLVPLKPHDRVVIHCENGLRLDFNDPRKFGRIWLTATPEKIIGSLGPDPLSADFTHELLHERLQSKHRMIKPLLLDQTFLAGLGNIYVDESLHWARIHPARISDTITEEEAGRLWACIKQTLDAAIRNHGSSIDWMYRGGRFQDKVRVYHRTGQPCLTCGTIIQRIVIGQRSTHICPHCQQL